MASGLAKRHLVSRKYTCPRWKHEGGLCAGSLTCPSRACAQFVPGKTLGMAVAELCFPPGFLCCAAPRLSVHGSQTPRRLPMDRRQNFGSGDFSTLLLPFHSWSRRRERNPKQLTREKEPCKGAARCCLPSAPWRPSLFFSLFPKLRAAPPPQPKAHWLITQER